MDTAVYELKAQARVNLTSEYGWQTRSLRPVEVESVFGNIKILVWAFTLRVWKGVKLEWGTLQAHNMRKMATANM